MNKLRFVAVVAAVLPVLMAARCPGGTETVESCNITARTDTTITLSCQDNHGKHTRDDVLDEPYDLYPKCQVNTYWPACKSA